MQRFRAMLLAAGLLAGVGCAPASAGMLDETGMKAWETCALCHALDGVSRMAKFPILAGQAPAYIEKQLRDFRAGRRTNDGGQMTEMAGQLAAADIPLVAAYFAAQSQPTPRQAAVAEDRRLAEPLARHGDSARRLPACLSCHGAEHRATSGAPQLAAQHADYLAKQLRDFRTGARANATVMAEVAGLLRAPEVDALARYFAARKRL